MNKDKSIKLHVGCGTKYFDGWINIDNNSDNNIQKLDLNWNLRNPLPFDNNTVDFIFNEHFLEHLTAEDGLRTLMDFKRVLKPTGVLRIAMPDLADLIKLYNNENWKKDYAKFIETFKLDFVKTRAEYVNMCFKWWGHQWQYDREELERRLIEAGFNNIEFCKLRKSKYPELNNLETRDESTLIAEASAAQVALAKSAIESDLSSKAHTKKIPCFLIAFFEYENIKKSLDFITKYTDRLDIHVIENYSENTEGQIKPYILDLIGEGKIKNYYLFDENIGANAIEVILRSNWSYLNNYEYFMITDGDLIIKQDKKYLDELTKIMDENPEVFAAGAEMSLENLPSEDKYPDAKTWVPKAHKVKDKNYAEGPTGSWFLLYRTKEFIEILLEILNANESLLDSVVYQHCMKRGMKWARTINNKAYHLTWDSYSDENNPYTKWKGSKTFNEIWQHNKYCGFTLINNDGAVHYEVKREVKST